MDNMYPRLWCYAVSFVAELNLHPLAHSAAKPTDWHQVVVKESSVYCAGQAGRMCGQDQSTLVNRSGAVLLLLLLSCFGRVRLCALCYPIDGSPPGFPVPGILQARTLGGRVTTQTPINLGETDLIPWGIQENKPEIQSGPGVSGEVLL